MTENKLPSTQEAFTKILTRLDQIEKKVLNPSTQLRKEWIDSQEVCEMLHISKRTLQNYRDQKRIPFSSIDGKMYYKYEDISSILEMNYTPIKTKNANKARCYGSRR
ncbi:MAG: helix-turn-helix domain-containing protein [Bacteroidales bacterium]|nr:helix-turn-helix domain-containing protein [Bacteroidales bacterium]MCF8456409.1 helix-turn-helix domain-containing protein [Bacteroidales bacterium]